MRKSCVTTEEDLGNYFLLKKIDFTSKSASFITVDVADGVSPFSYKVMLTSDNLISIEVIGDELDKKVYTWIKHCLLPKLVKWCDQELGEECQGSVSNSVQSLSLVDIEEYNDLYNELKMKYGLEMVKVIQLLPTKKHFIASFIFLRFNF